MCGAGWQGEDCSAPLYVPGAEMPTAKDDENAANADAGGPSLGLLANSPSSTELQASSSNSNAAGDTSADVSELLPQPSLAGMPEAMQEQPIQTQAPVTGLFEGTEMDGDADLDGHSVARPDTSGNFATVPDPTAAAPAGTGGLLGGIDTDNVPPNGL